MTTYTNTNDGSPREVVRTLFSFLDAQGQGDYMGEAVSQLQHSLQAAALAVDHGADEHTVLAALLHDVGRFIPEAASLPKLIAPDGSAFGTEAHEQVGEQYLQRLGFPPAVYAVVGAHVWAKRYLCATEPAYWASLSKLSKVTLELQASSLPPTSNDLVTAPLTDRAARSHATKWLRPAMTRSSKTSSTSGDGTTRPRWRARSCRGSRRTRTLPSAVLRVRGPNKGRDHILAFSSAMIEYTKKLKLCPNATLLNTVHGSTSRNLDSPTISIPTLRTTVTAVRWELGYGS